MDEITEQLHAQQPKKKLKSSRGRHPNWEKRDTIILIGAYRKQTDDFNSATNKGRMAANEQKWGKIASLCEKGGVSRDAEQCRKRWQDLYKNYKRIKEWDGISFWNMQSSDRKRNNLPGNFDKEIYDRIHEFKANCTNLDDDREIPVGQVTDAHGDPSSQDDSWYLGPRDFTKHNQNCQADSITEAVENSTRLAQEQCSAQMTEVLADVLLQMADAIKKVAENIRKRPR